MATVVYTAIQHLTDLAAAQWHVGVQDSYAETSAMADRIGGREAIRLVARMPERGAAQVVQCGAFGRDWVTCSPRHIRLAQFFIAKLADAPAGERLAPFFEQIGDDAVRATAGELVALECGAGAEYAPFNEVHDAILDICGVLSRLGVPAGDWVFRPVLAAYRELV